MFSRGHEVSDRPVVVFIVGAGHSGSTILNVALGANSYVQALGETSYLAAEWTRNSKCACGIHIRECHHWTNVATRMRGSGRDEALDIEKAPTGPTSVSESVKPLARHFAGRMGRRRAPKPPSWVENLTGILDINRTLTGNQILVDSSKSVHRAIFFDIYSDRYTVRYLHLVRDVRGVSHSFAKKSYVVDMPSQGRIRLPRHARQQQRPRASSLAWLKANLAASFLLAGTDRYIRVSYKDLCNEPRSVLEDLCAWLEIPFEAEMVSISHTDRHSVGGNTARFSQEGFRKADDSWRSQLSPEELEDISMAAKALNAYYGFRDRRRI